MSTQSLTTQTLHLPDGINYECTGCGRCCSGWAVPMTEADYKRISPINWGELLPKVKGRKLFRPLRSHEKKNTPYSNAIVEFDDGFCPFLVNNLCFIHGQRGSKFKPQMCQQFPYSFNETPSGIYATVSFVSMAVCNNTGKSLVEQRDYLEGKLADFRTLYPDFHPNWSKLELTGGKPISWDKYLEIEGEIIHRLKAKEKPLSERFWLVSKYLVSLARTMPSPTTAVSVVDGASKIDSRTARGSEDLINLSHTRDLEDRGQSSASANRPGYKALRAIDNHLLLALHSTYFPTRILRPTENEFQVNRFLSQIVLRGLYTPLKIAVPGHSYTLEELSTIDWAKDEPEVEDLLYRYFFSRIFGKLYFGAGFGQLTVIAGFHHLALIYALVKMQCKALAKARGAGRVNYIDAISSIRQLEKRLGEASLSGYAAAMFELLMFSPGRIERVLSAVS